MLLQSLILNLIDPLTVHAEDTCSCFLMSASFLKVALVRSSKKGSSVARLSWREILPIAEHEVAPVPGVEARNDGLGAVSLTRQDVGSFQECVTVGHMIDVPIGSGTLQDGE